MVLNIFTLTGCFNTGVHILNSFKHFLSMFIIRFEYARANSAFEEFHLYPSASDLISDFSSVVIALYNNQMIVAKIIETEIINLVSFNPKIM